MNKVQKKKLVIKYWKWNKYLLFVLLLLLFLLSIKNLPDCGDSVDVECYKYFYNFWGERHSRVSCDGSHDFYVIKSENYGRCKGGVYEKVYEKYEGG